ncbi:COP9 signalosome complex subunit 1b-like [Drosophila pseudoobscura]|uniref:COP9 signalosome complex subunit 1b-like n=1 Tax=Drosophila pseudoobscura pseudoobscura TaxID=46245 RepID=A0A6I8V3P5_DROPS|nr:COP9 signalosome complex subunit 1b [Drosophila pseudoobscura]
MSVPVNMPLPMQNAIEPVPANAAPTGKIVAESPSIDLEVYASRYDGIVRLQRLIHVAEVCPILREEALKMAITYVQTTYNVSLYTFLHKQLSELNPTSPAEQVPADSFAYDPVWVETKMKGAALQLEKLSSELRFYKSRSFKQSARRSLEEMADLYLSCGDLQSVRECHSRMDCYCTGVEDMMDMLFHIIQVFIYMQDWDHARTYITKTKSLDVKMKVHRLNGPFHTHLECFAGLAELNQKNYKVAAEHFLNANFAHCEQFLVSPVSLNDVAVYGGLCALATFDRPELKRQVIASTSFKLFLEQEPQVRDIIFMFHESKYASCLTLLDEIRDNLLVQMYIAPHVSTLYAKIRQRAMIQYFSPYQSADMHKMAVAFNSSVGDLENEVVQLIQDGHLQARIDSHHKILYAREVDQRTSSFRRALALEKSYQRIAKMTMLRAAVLQSKILVKSDIRTAGSKQAP